MTSSLRKEMKSKRRQKRMQERRNAILLMVGGILLITALFVVPPLLEKSKPVGEIKPISTVVRPMAKGTAAGDPNAKVRIDVFVDFQCPACMNYTQTVEKQVMDNYVASSKVYYVVRQFPFIDDNSATKESTQAANAAMCAAEQERFWDYHDMLFTNWNGENAGNFTDRRLTAFAEALKLDMNAFNTCFKEDRYQTQIQQDKSEGKAMGVNGTPSVFVNGKIVAPGYVPTYEQISQAVDAILNK